MFNSALTLSIGVFLFLSQNVFAGSSTVMGVLKNAYLNDRLTLKIPHYFLDGQSSSPIGFTDSEGRFSIETEILEPQLVFLVHNEDRLPIFLEPNDTVFISSDMFQFPLSVTFSGKGGHNNRLLKQFLMENPQDFNEFNNLRYKIGTWWTTVEADMDKNMDELKANDFRALLDKRKLAGYALLDEYNEQNPSKLSESFKNYLSSEILYDWAYHLLFYGNIYKVKHAIEPAFFEFLYDAPASSDVVGSEAYRRFLMTLMAYKFAQTGKASQIYAEQYLSASDYLSGKSLSFYRSEMIMLALKAEQYNEILPYYTSFLQANKHHEYDEKITNLYEKAVRVSPGVIAPSFSCKDYNGNEVSLEQFRGKVVYLNFWASWCGSCIKKMNIFNAHIPDFDNKGIVVLNISIDEDDQKWREAIVQDQLQGFHLLSKVPAGGRSVASVYNVEAVPQYFIINKNGTFAEKSYSSKAEDIKNQLMEIAK